jgi:2-keto-3-deoxy-6-phosphogluconate aldolase
VTDQVPDMAVGAGTIVRPEQAREAVSSGAASFCPTGGIDRATSTDYLALPNVACVGGSWLTPSDLVASRDWDAITALASDASRLRA